MDPLLLEICHWILRTMLQNYRWTEIGLTFEIAHVFKKLRTEWEIPSIQLHMYLFTQSLQSNDSENLKASTVLITTIIFVFGYIYISKFVIYVHFYSKC